MKGEIMAKRIESNLSDLQTQAIDLLKRLIALVHEEHGAPLEDWEYLIHHIEVVDEVEELHHCFMLDHLGNKYKTGHLIDADGKQHHILLGLVEDQDVFWSDQEAVEAGLTVPCPDRQLI